MNGDNALKIWELRTEAENLEYLLRHYLEDKAFLAENQTNEILYFADAHEIRAFIDPTGSENLVGFTLLVERAHFATSSEAFELEIKLRNELFLHHLLFDKHRQTGLLPSHAEEVDDEIAFKGQAWLLNRISLLDQARREIRKLRDEALPKQLIAASEALPSEKALKRKLVNFFRDAAPALMALLRPNPEDVRSRIDALQTESNLVGAADLAWKEIGFDASACGRLSEVRPKPEGVEGWRSYLSERRKRASNRANRIDSEAIAYLQALNRELEGVSTPSVRARLVTRAMSLTHAVRNPRATRTLGQADFVRHPRLLALRGPMESRGRNVTKQSRGEHAEEMLIVALRTYQKQLSAQSHDADENDWQHLEDAIEALVRAWHDFEKANLTIELHAQADVTTSADDGLISGAEFQELLRWFRRDGAVVDLIEEDLRKAIEQFRTSTFALGHTAAPSPVQARVIILNKPTRARIIPMIAGAPGPVEFRAQSLLQTQQLQPDLERLLSNLESNLVERYVAWSLIFACQRRWELAQIYARSAIEIGYVLQASDLEAGRDEARLLLAQVQRLGDHDASKRSKEAWSRYQFSSTLLTECSHPSDARILRERAAQILELHLCLEQEESKRPELDSGIALLHTALDLSKGDEDLQTYILELGLTYYLSAVARPMLLFERSSSDWVIATKWHEQLHRILTKQRLSRSPNEIARRARAMELIGFQLCQQVEYAKRSTHADQMWATQQLRIPIDLRLDVRDLRDQLKQSTDATAKLITEALDLLVIRLERNRERDLIYAPIWASQSADAITKLINEPHLRGRVKQTYDTLRQLVGSSQQREVVREHEARLIELASQFDNLSAELRSISGGDEGARDALFYLQMEACFARLLLTRIAAPGDVQGQLESLATKYKAIAECYPQASIPHFRLNTIFAELKQEKEEFDALARAIQLVEADPFLQSPGHWVRSTMRRRVAGRFSDQAGLQRERLREGSPDEHLLSSYLENVLTAFRTVYTDFDRGAAADTDYFYKLEARRRINNIIYYASLVLDACPESKELEKLGFTQREMRELLDRLHPDGIEKETELYVIHTIGFACAVLGQVREAASVGRRLIALMVEAGEDPKTKVVATLLADAFAWIRKGDESASDAAAPIGG